jgi:hypothetical protein
MPSIHPSRVAVGTTLAMSLAIVVAACGSPTPSPSPSNTPAASPGASASAVPTAAPSASASPGADVAQAFLAKMASPHFSADATITGDLEVGTVAFPVTGTYDVAGSDNRETLTIAVPGTPQSSQTITTHGVTYTRQDGLWFVKPATDPGSRGSGDLATALRSIFDLVDIGVETKAGQPLHHLRPRGSTSIPLSAIGATDPNGDGKVAFDFYVRDDGTPVVMTVTGTWTQPNGTTSQPVRMTIDFTFANVGGPIAIFAPGEVWRTFTSKRFGYSVAIPTDWEATQSAGATKPDMFQSAGDAGVLVYRGPTDGASLNEVTGFYVRQLKGSKVKATVTSNTATKLDGLRARRVEWSVLYNGKREYAIDTIVVRGRYVYIVEYADLAKPTDADREFLDSLLSTVSFPSKTAATSPATGQVG